LQQRVQQDDGRDRKRDDPEFAERLGYVEQRTRQDRSHAG
jgi:hypothetical protein